MNKIHAAVLSFLVLATFSIPSHALDQRINLTSNRDLALSGTFVDLSSGSNVGEASSYDWSKFKFEIHNEGQSPATIAGSIMQASNAICPGQFSLEVSVLRVCDFEATEQRLIVGAPRTASSGYTLKLTTLNKSAATIRVRSWLDLDGDNRVSAFEPTSQWRILNFIPAREARPFVNFTVAPPLLANRFMEATLNDGGNPLSGAGLFSLTSLGNLKVRLVSCDGFGCQSSFVTGTFNAHPQSGGYKFTGQRTNWDTGRYRFELIYSPGNVDDYVLAEQDFDYLNRTVISVETSIETLENIRYVGPILNLVSPWQEAMKLDPTEKSFTYSARVIDAKGEPVIGAEVYLYVDIKEVSSQTSVLADGVKLQSTQKDEVILKRLADSDGRVEVVFSNANAKDRDIISIDMSTQGLKVTEFQGSGGREFAVWSQPKNARLELQGGSSNNGIPTSLKVSMIGESGPVDDVSIGFSANEPLLLERTSVKTGTNGVANNSLRLSHLATSSGSAMVTVFTVYEGKAVTASYKVIWDSKGASLEAIPIPQSETEGANQKLTIGSFKGYVAIYALNYTGQKLSAKVAGRWIVQDNLSQFQRITRNTGAGFNIKVDLYIDGKFVRTENIVTK